MILFADIWRALRAMPLWVQIWMPLVLLPVNFGTLLFLDTQEGRVAAFLAIVAILPNAFVLWRTRAFPKSMALSHLVPWTALVAWIVYLFATNPPAQPLFGYLAVLLAVDFISLCFDYPDAWSWWRQRATRK